jgi:hypothetical protein
MMSSTRPYPVCSHQDHPAETIIPFLPLFHSLFPCISGLRYVGKFTSLCIKKSVMRVSSEKARTVGCCVFYYHLKTYCGSTDGKNWKKSPIWQWTVYNENSIFEQMAVPVIQSVSTPTPLLFLCLLPEACHCVARDEFYKDMPYLLPPRPPRRNHNSLPSPLPQPLSMHFRA